MLAFVTRCLFVGAIAIRLVDAAPIPRLEDDGQELLAGKDTRYYAFPFFWFGRPVYDGDDDNYAGNGGQSILGNRRPSTVSYANVGAGWGR